MLWRRGLEIVGRRVSRLDERLVWLRSAVVEGDFDANLAGVLAPACQALPDILLATALDDDVLEVDPRLADEVSLLVVCEDGHFELVVVGRVVDNESQFLVPGNWSA